ncbi:MAG: sulfatase [Chloroflexi bacterium]|nr:sulfatase [Chloroflexota bacterium]
MLSRSLILVWVLIALSGSVATSCAARGNEDRGNDANDGSINPPGKVELERAAPDSVPTATTATEAPGETSSRPNILLITIDTLRADHLGSYGNTTVKTPNLDALAQQGTRFALAISSFSQTNPAHASIFTSTYAATHGIKIHAVDKLRSNVFTLAEVLAGNGYTTAGIFSWPTFEPQYSGLERGFMTSEGVYVSTPGETDPWRAVDGRANLTTDAALRWLLNRPSGPFFLWIHYQDPHYPYTPPPPFDTMYDPDCPGCPDGGYQTIDRIGAGEQLSEAEVKHLLALYDGEVSFTDREIGRFLDGMKQANLLDNTLVIATSDHGESFNDNGRWSHPWILYNSVVRVPLIVRYPAMMPAGLVIRQTVRTIDIMPTILQTLGVPDPPQTEGQSLWPLVSAPNSTDDRMAFVQVPDDSSIAIVADGWKLIKYNLTGQLELYNLVTDPGELTNLASSEPKQASSLEQKLNSWMARNGIGP